MSRIISAFMLVLTASVGLVGKSEGQLVTRLLRDAAPEGAPVRSRTTLSRDSKLFVVLDSAIAFRATKDGESVYFHTVSPITQKNGFVIPINSFGQAAVTMVAHSSEPKGRKAVRLDLTSVVLPTGDTLALRGSSQWIEANGSRSRLSIIKVGDTVIGVATLGAVAALGKGALWGAGAGGLFGLAVGLFSHHAPAEIPQGTLVQISVDQGPVLDADKLLDNQ